VAAQRSDAREAAVEGLPLVLVVEDDYLAASFIEEALRDGGYQCAVVASGEEAITLFQSGSEGYLALATDINLHGEMDGWEVAQRVRQISPEFPVVYMTGAAADEWPSKGVPKSILLSKPFAPAQLVGALSQLLNAGSPPASPDE
jgi:CheY-like chemotaxis protein